MADKLNEKDLTSECWREYDFGGRVYRIDLPKRLFYNSHGAFHRILDEQGIVHCVPAPGEHGCVIRWKPKDSKNPVAF